MEFHAHHTAISVVDMQQSLSFYEQFGFDKVVHYKDPDGEFEIAHLKLNTTFLEIFWYKNCQAAPESSHTLATDLPRIGVKHFGLRVSSITDAKNFIEERGLGTNIEIREGKTGVTYFFIKDPSGILLEFVEDNRSL